MHRNQQNYRIIPNKGATLIRVPRIKNDKSPYNPLNNCPTLNPKPALES